MNHLYSKTMSGLLLLIAVAVALAALGKFTPEMCEFLKWIGGSFLGVRAVANFAESRNG